MVGYDILKCPPKYSLTSSTSSFSGHSSLMDETAAGAIEFIDMPMEDDEFEAGEAFGSFESARINQLLTLAKFA